VTRRARTIPSETEWIKFCLDNGWRRSDVPALRKLYRKVHPRPKLGLFAVKYHGFILPRAFSSDVAAKNWALKNFKGSREGWEIVDV